MAGGVVTCLQPGVIVCFGVGYGTVALVVVVVVVARGWWWQGDVCGGGCARVCV